MRRRRRRTEERPSCLPFGFERRFRQLSRRAQFFGLALFGTGFVVGLLLAPMWISWFERFPEAGLFLLLMGWTAFSYGCARLLDVLWPPTDPPPKSRHRRRWEQAELDEAYETLWSGMWPIALLALAGALGLVVWCYRAGELLWAGVLAAAIVDAFLIAWLLTRPGPRRRRAVS